MQVTSQIPDAQQFSINFANNNLMGSGNFLSGYRTGKARVCVTVGMMTTGYDCTDIPTWDCSAHLFAHRFHPDQGGGAPGGTISRRQIIDEPAR